MERELMKQEEQLQRDLKKMQEKLIKDKQKQKAKHEQEIEMFKRQIYEVKNANRINQATYEAYKVSVQAAVEKEFREEIEGLKKQVKTQEVKMKQAGAAAVVVSEA